MATYDSTPFCDICQHRDLNKSAEEYCLHCEEALCSDCTEHHKISISTKSHQTISIEKYYKLPTFIKQISHNCQEHGCILEFYCKSHDSFCCKICSISAHKECKEIIYIDDFLTPSKGHQSVALDNIQKVLKKLESNISSALKNRKNNLTELREQKREISEHIKDKRYEVNVLLDHLEVELLEKVSALEKTNCEKIEEVITKLEDEKEKVEGIQKDVESVKMFASDLQIFMGTKAFQESISTNEINVQKVYDNGSLNNVTVKCPFNEKLEGFIKDIKTFGDIEINNSETHASFSWKGDISAQILKPKSVAKSIGTIIVRLGRRINIGCNGISGCAILEAGNMLFLQTHRNNMMQYAPNGEFISESRINPERNDSIGYDLAVIDFNTLAVSSGGNPPFTSKVPWFLNICKNNVFEKLNKRIAVDKKYFSHHQSNQAIIDMAANESPQFCDVCLNRDLNKTAEEYCPQCEEVLCGECRDHHKISRSSKSHKTITVDKYNILPSFIKKIKHNCEEHDFVLEFFCKSHDSLCCKICSITAHKACKEIMFIEDFLTPSKGHPSVALDNIEKVLKNLESNISSAIKDKNRNLTDLREQKRVITEIIKEKRQEINKLFDNFEEALLKKASALETECCQKIEEVIAKLIEEKTKVDEIKKDVESVKSFASNLQIFVGSKSFEENVSTNELKVQKLYDDGSLNDVIIECTFNEKLEQFIKEINTFGDMKVDSSEKHVSFTWKGDTSAQIYQSISGAKSVENINVKIVRKINVGRNELSGCVMSESGNMLFLLAHKNSLIKYSSNGEFHSELHINTAPSNIGYDLAVVDSNTIAVSTGGNNPHKIYLIDINNAEVRQDFDLKDYCYGLSYHKGSLVCCTQNQGIHIFDKSKKVTNMQTKSYQTTDMATDKSVLLCDVCQNRHLNKSAEDYCPQCEEALCRECRDHHNLSKLLKSHQTITVDKYNKLPSFIRQISQNCEEHDCFLEFFCKSHDAPCCKLCLISCHKECKETIFIEDFLKPLTWHQSAALDNIEKILEDLQNNICSAIKDRTRNLNEIREQKRVIGEQIKAKRKEINTLLKRLEEEFLEKVSSLEKTNGQEIEEIITKLEDEKEKVEGIQKEFESVKMFASNLQIFMATKSFQESISYNKINAQQIYDNGSLNNLTMKCNFNEKIEGFIKHIKTFGDVEIDHSEKQVSFSWKGEESAQFFKSDSKSIETINVRLGRRINIDSESISGCAISEAGNMLFLQTHINSMMKYAPNGEFISESRISPALSLIGYDLAVIDSNTVAVSSGGNSPKQIYLIDMNSSDSNNVVVISPDGKQAKELIGASDGLANPCALFFHKTKNLLLVANYNRGASVYDVI
ncbi:uncharacterized protein LOC134694331 [Mytilus trossulus]|uniref:uncharacterized protein LOC134694331 n=1 Tax=Mytilus trossulus TaxID=6551 RepID=UPI003006A9FB